VNVEFVARGPSPDELVLRVWERGVGETRACGSGSCAAAAAARSWGLVGDRVLVHNPGGTLEVCLGPGPDDPVVLGGPVRRVAEVVVDLRALDLQG
jgi:diaminopimelate epimerase